MKLEDPISSYYDVPFYVIVRYIQEKQKINHMAFDVVDLIYTKLQLYFRDTVFEDCLRLIDLVHDEINNI